MNVSVPTRQDAKSRKAQITTQYMTVTLSFAREGNKWVGGCLELGTSTFARTLKACREELQELVADHLNVMEEVGERARFFEDWGITLQPTEKVPAQFTVRGSGDSWNKLFQDTIDSNGPFLVPRVVPIDMIEQADGNLVSR